jgi:ribosome-associated protein
VVTGRSADERSQLRNREKALDRLRQKLADALKVSRPRVATAPSAAARRRRVEEKKRRGELKRQRRADPFA